MSRVKNLGSRQKPGGVVGHAGRNQHTVWTGSSEGDAKYKAFALSVINDPEYQAKILEQARAGLLHPSMQAHLSHAAIGKPKEQIEVAQIVPVRIVHRYTDRALPARADDPLEDA